MNNSAPIDWTIPTTVDSGKNFYVTLVVKNTGNTTWRVGKHKLGDYSNTGTFGPYRIDLLNNVAPGQQYAFNFQCTMPNQTALFEYRMLEEGVEWFGVRFYATITTTTVVKRKLPAYDGKPHDRKGQMIFELNNIEADGLDRVLLWENTSGHAINIIGYSAFIGISIGGVCDTAFYVLRVRDNSWVAWFEWDHYADPVAPNHSKVVDFGNYPVFLGEGERLKFISRTNPVGQLRFHHSFRIYFVYPS